MRSPASTRTGIRFSWGGNGHVAKALYAHGGFCARLKSIVTLPASGSGV